MTQEVVRSEAARQFYLGMAGIRTWYAREPLPGAAPSSDLDFGTVHRDLATAESPSPVKPAPVPISRSDTGNKDKLARLKTLMGAEPERPSMSAGSQSSLVVEGPEDSAPLSSADDQKEATDDAERAGSRSVSVTQAPKLCLQCWTGDRVLLLANLSEEASLSLQETLALNIVRSLGETATHQLGVLRWPLFNNLKVSLNSETNLAVLLREYLANDSGKSVITLGLPTDSSVIANILGDVLEKTPDIVFDQSLAALAANPDLKRQLWQLIKPLAAGAR
ncbi:hypothetical protein [Marinobacter sp.]|uniref:hypothetical protein n=1 Tax=Marinobacter sp. TaxID=50741 RepID=UPI0019F54B0D|nr:hypothetical protein [Marinobacter sp.]MBE0484897.1 hypothetical protein [Marinobacter sp.]